MKRVSNGEFGLLCHLYPKFGLWRTEVSTASCGCKITRYFGKDMSGELEDLIVAVIDDGTTGPHLIT